MSSNSKWSTPSQGFDFFGTLGILGVLFVLSVLAWDAYLARVLVA